jgi:hypothetical protein
MTIETTKKCTLQILIVTLIESILITNVASEGFLMNAGQMNSSDEIVPINCYSIQGCVVEHDHGIRIQRQSFERQ